MNRAFQKNTIVTGILFLSLALAGPVVNAEAANKTTTKLSTKSTSVTKGKTTTIRIKNRGKKKVSWKITKTNKKYITVAKKSSNYIKLKGKKAGTTTIKVKVGKKTYSCKIKVKNPGKKTSSKALTSEQKSKRLASKVDVKVTTTTTNPDGAKEVREYLGIPDDIKSFDTVTIKVTNRNSKAVKINMVNVRYTGYYSRIYYKDEARYDKSLAMSESEKGGYCLWEIYRPVYTLPTMKTITVNPGETKSITYGTTNEEWATWENMNGKQVHEIIAGPYTRVGLGIKEAPFDSKSSTLFGYDYFPYTGKVKCDF